MRLKRISGYFFEKNFPTLSINILRKRLKNTTKLGILLIFKRLGYKKQDFENEYVISEISKFFNLNFKQNANKIMLKNHI